MCWVPEGGGFGVPGVRLLFWGTNKLYKKKKKKRGGGGGETPCTKICHGSVHNRNPNHPPSTPPPFRNPGCVLVSPITLSVDKQGYVISLPFERGSNDGNHDLIRDMNGGTGKSLQNCLAQPKSFNAWETCHVSILR